MPLLVLSGTTSDFPLKVRFRPNQEKADALFLDRTSVL